MELRLLKYFLAVAREQSITAAAESLHITQPSLSKGIQTLEEELGKQLLIRTNRNVLLTEDGLFVQKQAKEILDMAEKLQAGLSSREALRGDVYIGSSETGVFFRVAQVIHRIYKEYPQIRFHIFSGTADLVLDRLSRGLLDFGILLEAPSTRSYLQMPLPSEHRWGFYMRSDDPYAAKGCITPQDIPGLPLIVSDRHEIRQLLAGWAGLETGELTIAASYNLILNAAFLVRAGIGCAFSPDGLLETPAAGSLRFVPAAPALPEVQNIVWKRSSAVSPACRIFLEQLREELSPLP
ncbi:MAG: LysR family transcriptional regulator [Lachnospiraceae bacterium]|nr:LysR family transcriptional regulator [Lachnospiraceae bacterium]